MPLGFSRFAFAYPSRTEGELFQRRCLLNYLLRWLWLAMAEQHSLARLGPFLRRFAHPHEGHSLVYPAGALADSHLLVKAPEQAQCLMDSVRFREPESSQFPDTRSDVLHRHLGWVLPWQQLQQS
jgi:hypothetical protein